MTEQSWIVLALALALGEETIQTIPRTIWATKPEGTMVNEYRNQCWWTRRVWWPRPPDPFTGARSPKTPLWPGKKNLAAKLGRACIDWAGSYFRTSNDLSKVWMLRQSLWLSTRGTTLLLSSSHNIEYTIQNTKYTRSFKWSNCFRRKTLQCCPSLVRSVALDMYSSHQRTNLNHHYSADRGVDSSRIDCPGFTDILSSSQLL